MFSHSDGGKLAELVIVPVRSVGCVERSSGAVTEELDDKVRGRGVLGKGQGDKEEGY